MSRIRVDPLISCVRCFQNEIDFTLPLSQMKEPYYKTFPITFTDNGIARFSSVITPPTLREFTELKRYLRSIGYYQVEWRHKDKMESFKI